MDKMSLFHPLVGEIKSQSLKKKGPCPYFLAIFFSLRRWSQPLLLLLNCCVLTHHDLSITESCQHDHQPAISHWEQPPRASLFLYKLLLLPLTANIGRHFFHQCLLSHRTDLLITATTQGALVWKGFRPKVFGPNQLPDPRCQPRPKCLDLAGYQV